MTELAAAVAGYVDELLALFENVTAAAHKQWEEYSSEGSVVESIRAFVGAVDWTEPWLIGLMCFHLVLLGLVILTRNHNSWQMTLFFSALMGIYFAERLNTVLDQNWKRFARQPYFDRHGVFLSTVWSAPILLISSLILVNSLMTLTKLLIQWKRAELKHRARAGRVKAE